jgi:two-component system sensor histidine kinase ChiS
MEYNLHRLSKGYVPVQIGIGINTGTLMLGTVGGTHRMDSTVISDAVNLASRLEGLTKDYGVPLLISHHTFSRLRNRENYAIRMIDKVKVKGKSELVTVYEVFEADTADQKAAKLATKEMFAKALALYEQKEWGAAKQLFEECLKESPGDTVARSYLRR